MLILGVDVPIVEIVVALLIVVAIMLLEAILLVTFLGKNIPRALARLPVAPALPAPEKKELKKAAKPEGKPAGKPAGKMEGRLGGKPEGKSERKPEGKEPGPAAVLPEKKLKAVTPRALELELARIHQELSSLEKK